MLHFTHMRHQFLIGKSHSRLAQARTVLVTSVPDELANEHDLRLFASFVPGGIDRIWMYRDTGTLNDLFDKRVDACHRLESAEAALLKSATLVWRQREKQHQRVQSRKMDDEENNKENEKLVKPPPSMELLNDLVPSIHRPRHRTGILGLLGPKVDTIEWCKVLQPYDISCVILTPFCFRLKFPVWIGRSKREENTLWKESSWEVSS